MCSATKIQRLLIKKKGLQKILVLRQNTPSNFLLKEGCSLPRVPEDIFFLSILMFRGETASTKCKAVGKNGQEKTCNLFCNTAADIAAKRVE